MNIIELIEKKKNNEKLSYEELKYIVDGYLDGSIKDYQMSSFLMAICLTSMSDDEVFDLTKIMIDSGEIMDLSKISGIKVDKHSTGGIGDKTSLVVLPIVSSCGVPVCKMSGRGLGITGGTIDKLESINGFKTNLTEEEFINEVNDIKMAIVSQTKNLVPADKKIYALRDVTGTTDSIPLIASSIMSKKIASGSDKILLDVKFGSGAFMKNIDDAKKLANLMVKIGKSFNKETVCILSNMDYPLGSSIGNLVEVKEAIDTLDHKGNKDFLDFCLVLSSYMVSMGKNISLDDALDLCYEKYNDKTALNKLYDFIKYQGGNLDTTDELENKILIKSDKEGYLNDLDTKNIALFVNSLGAGRVNKEDIINHNVGLVFNKFIGDKVNINDELCTIYSNNKIDDNKIKEFFKISDTKCNKIKLIYDIVK